MSKIRALKAINLEATDRIPTAGIARHPRFIESITNYDLRQYPRKALAQACKKLDIDLVFELLPTPISTLKQGEVEYSEDRRTARSAWGMSPTMDVYIKPPFDSPEEVIQYNPQEEKQVGFFGNFETHAEDQRLVGENTLICGYFYNTLFMWPVTTFGWELFMTTAALYPDKFGALIKKFIPFSKKYFHKWAETDVPLIMSHDDITMTNGPVFKPEWYRKYIFPYYEEIWSELKEKGKKILFCSDGDLTSFIPELAELGADGFLIEPLVDLEYLAKNFGDSKIIIGGIDTRILTFGNTEDVKKEVRRVTEIFKDCPGYFYLPAGDFPINMPVENIWTYYNACKEYGERGG